MYRLLLPLVLLVASGISCSKGEDSPNGPDNQTGSLYYSSADALIRYDFKTRKETTVFQGGDSYTVAPEKGKFAWYENDFYAATSLVHVHDLQTPSEARSIELDAIVESAPEFAPGEELLGSLSRSGDAPDSRTDLVLFNFQGQLIGRIPHVKDFAFSPNGSDLLISAEALNDKGEVAGYALALVQNYRSNDQKTLTIKEFSSYQELPSDIAVSPSSAHAAYTYRDHLYTSALQEGSVSLQVTTSRFTELDAAWSPDGKYLVFTASAEGDFSTGCGELRIVPAHPASPVEVPENAWDNAPADPMQPVNSDGKVIHSCDSESIYWVH